MTTRKRLLGYAAAGTFAVAGAALTAGPAEAQTITGYYCSAAVAVPGTYGTFTHCASFVLSGVLGTPVSKVYNCEIKNNTGKNVNWYSEARYDAPGARWGNVAMGSSLPPGTWQVNCTNDYPNPDWIPRSDHWFMRASVQAAGASGTAGANVYTP